MAVDKDNLAKWLGNFIVPIGVSISIFYSLEKRVSLMELRQKIELEQSKIDLLKQDTVISKLQEANLNNIKAVDRLTIIMDERKAK